MSRRCVTGIPERVAVIGGGAIGAAFACVCADAGAAVVVADPDAAQRADLAERVAQKHGAMASAGLARGPADAAVQRVAAVPSVAEAAEDALLVIETGPERLDAKQAIFAELLAATSEDTPICTASSAITASQIVPDAAAQRRCMVAHPANPPTLLRVLEIVPAPGTAADAVERADAAFRALGFDPSRLGKEVPGFVFNRLQGAILREAYRLVDEGVIDVDGLDRLVRNGIGPRWALCGPFENAELNTAGGIRGHAARMGPAYRAIGEARGETAAGWSDALVARVEAERRALCAEGALPERRAWRERALARLLAARKALMTDGDGG